LDGRLIFFGWDDVVTVSHEGAINKMNGDVIDVERWQLTYGTIKVARIANSKKGTKKTRVTVMKKRAVTDGFACVNCNGNFRTWEKWRSEEGEPIEMCGKCATQLGFTNPLALRCDLLWLS